MVRLSERRLWQPNILFLSAGQHFSVWNVAILPQDNLFFGNAARTLPQSCGIGCRRIHGPTIQLSLRLRFTFPRKTLFTRDKVAGVNIYTTNMSLKSYPYL